MCLKMPRLTQIDHFLKQLFCSLEQGWFFVVFRQFGWLVFVCFLPLKEKHSSNYTQTRPLNSNGRNQTNQSPCHLAHFLAKAGLSCRVQFTFQVKINICNLFHSPIAQRATHLEASQKIHTQVPKKSPLPNDPVCTNMFLIYFSVQVLLN